MAFAALVSVHHQQSDPWIPVPGVLAKNGDQTHHLAFNISGKQDVEPTGARVLAQFGLHLLGLNACGVVLAGGTAVLGIGRVDAGNLGDIVRREPKRRKRQRRHAGNSNQSRCRLAREYGVQDRAVKTGASPDTRLRDLAATVPDYVTADLQRQLALASPVFERFRALPPHQVVCGPVFAGSADIGGADADFIVDGLLLDCKATVSPSRLGNAEINQLAGYLLLDYDDQYGIDRVGLYLSLQEAAVTWKVGEFLELTGATTPLRVLREQLRIFLRIHRDEGKPA